MHVAVVHDRVTGTGALDAVDVLAQADAVEAALAYLGHTSVRLSCALDLADVRGRLLNSGADMVMNLVESIEGKGRLIHLFPFLLDAMGLPYTGARAEAMLFTSNKLLAKRKMTAAGIPTPPWVAVREEAESDPDAAGPSPAAWIVKSVWEHASIGLDETSIIRGVDRKAMCAVLKARSTAPGDDYFSEGFVEGREFNLSLLAGPDGPVVLPPAEIIFEGYTKDMPRIVDYSAKWDEGTYAFHHTPRRFDFEPMDRTLLESIKTLSLRCWKCFDLSGYARVDFRVDEAGSPWVLEVNANPCLSPDAGFAAALDRAGISMAEAVTRILNDANVFHKGLIDG